MLRFPIRTEHLYVRDVCPYLEENPNIPLCIFENKTMGLIPESRHYCHGLRIILYKIANPAGIY